MKPMKKSAIGGVLIVLCAVVMEPAFATPVTGPIAAVRISGGVTPARVSIRFVGLTTACSTPEWYAYESADTGLGKAWTDGLLAAYAQNRQVAVTGTNTCDGFGVEKIKFIDLFPF